jgi:manganese/zinc/iron transport system substrate-binding protein
MIADMAAILVEGGARVQGLMGPGVDPHLFKASEGDVRRLAEADLILYNGLHLEGKMVDILAKMGRSKHVVAVGESLPEDLLLHTAQGQVDPHIWFDVSLWSRTMEASVVALCDLLPESAVGIRARAVKLQGELEVLDAWAREQIQQIPERGRVLVTAHDAFGYFGRRYGIEVLGLQGISTASEAGIRDVERLVDVIVGREVPALFVESSVPRRSIEAVQAACRARGHEVSIGGSLFSDAMGAEGTEEGTYQGMVRHNVKAIVSALGRVAASPTPGVER